jgi:hypothetical protein
MPDFPKKYWWLVLIFVPVVIAFIGSLPGLLTALQKAGDPELNSRAKENPTSTTTSSDDRSAPKLPDGLKVAPTSESTIPIQESTNTPVADEHESTEGSPNLEKKVIRATGVGYPPMNVQNAGQRAAMARRAAETIALRNLTEAIRGAIISSQSETREGVLSSDIIQVRVEAVLRHATKIGEKENPDGSVEVVMEAPTQQ